MCIRDSAPGVASGQDPSVFYYSDNSAFDEMLSGIRLAAGPGRDREPERVPSTG